MLPVLYLLPVTCDLLLNVLYTRTDCYSEDDMDDGDDDRPDIDLTQRPGLTGIANNPPTREIPAYNNQGYDNYEDQAI